MTEIGKAMAAETSPNHCPPPSTVPYPWLVFWHDKAYEGQTFCTMTESGSFQVEPRRRSIPELQGKQVLCCRFGWLVLLENKNQYSLWNPSTMDSINLPPQRITKLDFRSSSLLTSPPRTTNSWLLIFDLFGPNILCVRLDHDDRQWVLKKFGEEIISMQLQDDDESQVYFSNTCCCNGVVVVCMTDNHHCLALDINPDDGPVNLRTITRGNPFGTGEVFRCSLVEFQGHVFSVEISHGGVRWAEVIRIEISRLNLNTQEWEQVDSVKDQVFFLGDEYDVCCLALSSDQERGGHIFFTFYNEKLIYSYNIVQKSLSIALRYPDLPMPCSRPAWVMPNYRLVDDQEKSNSEIVVGKDEIVDQEVKHNEEESDCKDSKVIDLLGFPQTIIEELADRLVLLDYFNFRVVCKRFSMAAPAICWRQTLKMKSAESCLFPPCLMFVEGDDRKAYNLIDTKFSGRYFMRIPEELEDATICFSNKGWLLLRKNDTSMFFYNPFTRVVLRCPDKPRMSLPFVRFVLSSVPTSSECLVVGIVATGDKRVFIQILQDKVWTRLDFSYESDFEPNSPVFWNGAFYILGDKGNLGVVKREELGDYSWNVLDDPKPPCEPFTFNQNFLVECDKDLLSIFVGDFGKWVRVFRLDQSGLVWNEVYSLGNKTLHLSRSSSFSTVAMYKEMENRIYFPRLHKGSLVFYSLETQKLHSCNFPEDSLVDFCGSSEQLLCGWIEPKWS